MRYFLLGNTGLRVSELCLGTMTFGEKWGWGDSSEGSQRQLELFAEAGGNFVDTAILYTDGQSEKILGELVAPERDKWVIATKYTFDAGGAGGYQFLWQPPQEHDALGGGQPEASENWLHRPLLSPWLGFHHSDRGGHAWVR